MRLRTFFFLGAVMALFSSDGVRAQIVPPAGGSICALSGTQTTGYVLTATNGGTACAWQTVGGASVDNNTLKNAWFISDLSGSANTISGTTATTFPGAYAKGQSVIVQVANTNTGATVININTLGNKNVTKNGNTALAAGNLVAGNDYLMTYDGTEFEVLTFTVLAVDIPTLNQYDHRQRSNGDGSRYVSDALLWRPVLAGAIERLEQLRHTGGRRRIAGRDERPDPVQQLRIVRRFHGVRRCDGKHRHRDCSGDENQRHDARRHLYEPGRNRSQ